MRISELTFELGDTVLYQLTILDQVLADLGLPPVSENSDFLIDKSSGTFGLDMSVVRSGRNTVPVDFLLEGGGMRIDIDNIPETFEWANKNMEEPNELVTFLKQLFTSYVLLEYYGSHTVMSLFDKEGRSVFKTTLRCHGLLGVVSSISSILLNRSRTEKLFLPIYPK